LCNVNILKKYIEDLRQDLEKAIKEKNSLADADILFLSRKLDKSINKYYRVSKSKKSKGMSIEKDV
jgi:hypothetical protein